MVFNFVWNGITFEMEYVNQEDADSAHWTDVDFTNYTGCGDIVIEKEITPALKVNQIVANIDISAFTYSTHETIRKDAYAYFLANESDIREGW